MTMDNQLDVPESTRCAGLARREFFLPELPRLLPFAYHPHAAEIEFASNGWVRRQLEPCFSGEAELLTFLRQRNGIYGPLTVPAAPRRRAQDIADWYQYVTVIDTAVSDRSALGASDDGALRVFADILAEFRGETPQSEPPQERSASLQGAAAAFGAAGRDLWERISPGLSARQTTRFVDSLATFLRGCASEIRAKLVSEVPDYETCMAVRLNSFGCHFIELMTEYGAAVDMSDVLSELSDLHDHCRRQMIIVNDLLSWRKEQAQDDKMTVVRVLTERQGLELQTAVDRLCELVDRHERAYVASRDLILAGPLGQRSDVRRYLRGLDHMMGGSQEFEYLTPRYFGDGYVWDGSTSGWIDLDAAVTRLRPYPSNADDAGADAVSKRLPRAAATPPVSEGCPVSAGSVGNAEEPSTVTALPASARTSTGSDRVFKAAVAPGALPVLGHALQLWRRPLTFVASLPARADLVEVRLGPRPAFLACHPEIVMQMLVDGRTFDKGGPLFEKARLLVGNGLVSSNWQDHRLQRRMLQPAFHPSRMRGYVELMREEVASVTGEWQGGRTFDLNAVMHALTLRITARTLFGTTVDATTVPEVAYCMPIIMRGVYQRMVAPLGLKERLPTRGNRRFNEVRSRMHAIVRRTVDGIRATATDEGDLLSILVAARDDGSGASLTDEEIYDQVMTLLIGGTETTGNTMTWAQYLISERPDVEARLHDELDRTLDGRLPDFDDLPRLDYTWRVLQETLRMYPPAWLLTRTTTRDVELAGRWLPAGTTVMYSPYALGRNAELFTDAALFDPDRWLPDRARRLPRGAMVAFGAGSRKCIGDRFGQAEVTLTLASIALHWRLRPIPGAKPRPGAPKASLGTGRLPMTAERRR